jgi:WD40 repeat protein
METYLKESSPVKPAISETSHEDETSEFQRSLLEDQNKAEYSDSKQSDKKPYADKTMTKSELNNHEQESAKEEQEGDHEEHKFRMEVNPIMKMDYVIGYSGKHVKWSPNKDDKSIVYASGGLLVSMDIKTNKQRFFMGHTDLVTCFAFSMDGKLIASGQDGVKPMVRIWDYETGKTFSVINPKLKSVECISFNCDRSTLAVSGRDAKNKETICLWDVSVLNANSKPIQLTRQISNFNIISMKFSPIDPYVLMSCGRENIRCWRLKNDHLQGASIVLDHRARNTIFTDVDYEFGFKSSDTVENESLSRILVSSKTGLIMIINYHSKKLENAFQIHDGPIQSISVNEAFCVTGSEDHLLRVWLLDFSEYFIEAPHDGTVSAVDISPDGTQIVCGTSNGSLGMVDIAKEKYVTLLRSHSDEIISADYNKNRNYIITASRDKTIRLWGVDGNFQKIYEFVSPNDQAIAVSSHPSQPLFSCGFESGTLRVFDIERTKVCEIYSQFNLPLVELCYSSDSRLLLTASKDGYLAIHNVKLQHQPIKMIPVDFPPPHISVAFDPTNSLFAAFGDNGNIINVYDSVNFGLVNTVKIKKDVGK